MQALIDGLALTFGGTNRATGDVDCLVEAAQRQAAEKEYHDVGFRVFASSVELIQREGFGKVDLLFAQRPLSRKMLADASSDGFDE
jgi:hypothetical protein